MTLKWWMVPLKYVLFVLLGWTLARAGSPSLAEATSSGFLFWYGVVVASVSFIAFIGWVVLNWLEMVGALLLWLWLLVWVGATSGRALEGNAGVQSASLAIIIISLLPMLRGFSLLFDLLSKLALKLKHTAS